MRQVSSLTGLRGVAALWVVLYHLTIQGPALGAHWLGAAPGLSAGWVGVDLFFVLSGFILMWVHGAEFAKPTLAVLRRFAALRLVRVYPLSLVVLALIAVLAVADPGFVAVFKARNPDNFSAGAFLRTALLATRWFPSAGGEWNEPVWSLSAELVGYAAFPLAAFGLANRSRGVALAVGATALAALALFEIKNGVVGLNTIDQGSALTRMIYCFIAGMAACRIRQLVPEELAPRMAVGAPAILAVLAVCITFKAGFVLAPALFAGLIFSLSFTAGSVDRWLSSAPVIWLGKVSFPLYLAHLTPLLWLVAHLRGAGLGQAAATGVLTAYIAASLGAAYLLHRGIEQPLHRWARQGFPLSPPRAWAAVAGR